MMTALRAVTVFRASGLQRRLQEELMTKHGAVPFEVEPWVVGVVTCGADLDNQRRDRKRLEEKGVHPETSQAVRKTATTNTA